MPDTVVVHTPSPVAVHVKESPEPALVSVEKPIIVSVGYGQGLPGRPGDKGDKGDTGDQGPAGNSLPASPDPVLLFENNLI